MPATSFAFPRKFPGYGLPVNYKPGTDDGDTGDCLLPNALTSHGLLLPMIPLQERLMLQFMNTVTDKENWFSKITDPDIVQKWASEAANHTWFVKDPEPWKLLDWAVAELEYNAERIRAMKSPPPPTWVFNGDVYKSDTALSLEFKKRLQDAVAAFEAKIPDEEKDWHPGSNDTVWDLVHPSLFPVVYGRTRVLSNNAILTLDDCISRCLEGDVLAVPDDTETIEPDRETSDWSWSKEDPDPLYSKNFQWIPCEVDISQEKARVTTYINNLHPVHEVAMYALIEEIITAAIPMWELTLAPLHPNASSIRQRVHFNVLRYESNFESWPEDTGPQEEVGETRDECDDRYRQWVEESRVVVLPYPATSFRPIERPQRFDLKKFKDRGLQAIVKLANIQLTPDRPSYEGGSWHVEGQINEHIVATALYYYSNENITSSHLSFRHQVNTELDTLDYPQHHTGWLKDIFGCENEGPGVQDTGAVATSEGRLLTFPNILQHRVESFKLEDPIKPGHRKIVALFLVDPHLKILSTAKIPCQRKDWWLEHQTAHTKALRVKETDHHSPSDFPLTLEEAKELRLKLMEERKIHDKEQRDYFEIMSFALCEH